MLHFWWCFPAIHCTLCETSPFSPDVGIGSRLLAGCTTGAMAVAMAQPTDVVKVRFQAQVSAGAANKRYHGTMDAYRTIAKEEGFRGLWKGKSLEIRHLWHVGSLSSLIQKCYYLLHFRNWTKHYPQRYCELY